jgi:hypothetical protein
MNRRIFIFLLLLLVGSAACHRQRGNPPDNANLPEIADTTTTFTASAGRVANSIVYDVIIKNANPYDTWTTECLSGLDRSTFVDELFRAIYEGKLTAIDFDTEEKLSPEEVKKLEKEIKKVRSRIAKLQFTEDWYFDTLSLTMQKDVRSIVLGYEVYDDQGAVRGYKPVFRVDLNQNNH